MRDIKFRVWNTKGEYFMPIDEDPDYLFLCDANGLHLWNNGKMERDVVMLQFTGLKDKNGKDIYEGDIIGHGEYYDTPEMGYNKIKYCAVTFDDGAFRIYNEHLFEEEIENNETFYVAGNIYENPELLKQK